MISFWTKNVSVLICWYLYQIVIVTLLWIIINLLLVLFFLWKGFFGWVRDIIGHLGSELWLFQPFLIILIKNFLYWLIILLARVFRELNVDSCIMLCVSLRLCIVHGSATYLWLNNSLAILFKLWLVSSLWNPDSNITCF